jgi:hypothetical protein
MNNPSADIAALCLHHNLTPSESKALYSVLDAWPEEQVSEGIAEEIENILAMRKIKLLTPLNVADFTHIPIAVSKQ